jgi:hypothetical protein
MKMQIIFLLTAISGLSTPAFSKNDIDAQALATTLELILLPRGETDVRYFGKAEQNDDCYVNFVRSKHSFSAYLYAGTGENFRAVDFTTFMLSKLVKSDLRAGERVFVQIEKEGEDGYSQDKRNTLNITFKESDNGDRRISKVNIIEESKSFLRWQKEIAINCVLD